MWIFGNTILGHVVSALKWLGFRGVLILMLILMLISVNVQKTALNKQVYRHSVTISTLNATIANLNEQNAILSAKKKAAQLDLQEADAKLAEAQKDCSRRVSNAARAQSIPPIKQKVIYVKNEQGESVPSPIQCDPLYSVRDIQRAVNSN